MPSNLRNTTLVRSRLSAAWSGRFCVAVWLSLFAHSRAHGQKDSTGEARSVEGRVTRPRGGDAVGVAGLWIVLHRVGSDRAAPLDSVRSASDGAFRIRYRATGSEDAIYFVAAQYGGIAYFSQPLRAALVSGEDAEITVFDTTSGPVPLHVRGRHIVVSASAVNGAREVVEVYEISNDSSVTLISPDDARPTWTAMVPREAGSFRAGQSDISAEAMRLRDGRVNVIAPVAPGLKQISFSYQLPASSFPLSIPLQRAAQVLEVLLEDSTGTADGAKLSATANVSVEGRAFRRFVASDVPANAVIRIAVASAPGPRTALYVAGLALAIGAAMLLSLARVFAREPATVAPMGLERAPPPDDPERIARVIASLDEEFERGGDRSQQAREAYSSERSALKERLQAALAERGKQA
ncbi:MAG: hypothetical protein H7Z74_09115 [Anaerolineae bacterium]|nr:hypothetical protein [Gemmatimonadaceae bacterium]